MAKHQSEANSVNSNISMNNENYNTLLQTFKEIHEEVKILALSNNQLKGLNNWMENKINSPEEELLTVKIDFDDIEMIYKLLLTMRMNCVSRLTVRTLKFCKRK